VSEPWWPTLERSTGIIFRETDGRSHAIEGISAEADLARSPSTPGVAGGRVGHPASRPVRLRPLRRLWIFHPADSSIDVIIRFPPHSTPSGYAARGLPCRAWLVRAVAAGVAPWWAELAELLGKRRPFDPFARARIAGVAQ
jgi:hypothetical protein